VETTRPPGHGPERTAREEQLLVPSDINKPTLSAINHIARLKHT